MNKSKFNRESFADLHLRKKKAPKSPGSNLASVSSISEEPATTSSPQPAIDPFTATASQDPNAWAQNAFVADFAPVPSEQADWASFSGAHTAAPTEAPSQTPPAFTTPFVHPSISSPVPEPGSAPASASQPSPPTQRRSRPHAELGSQTQLVLAPAVNTATEMPPVFVRSQSSNPFAPDFTADPAPEPAQPPVSAVFNPFDKFGHVSTFEPTLPAGAVFSDPFAASSSAPSTVDNSQGFASFDAFPTSSSDPFAVQSSVAMTSAQPSREGSVFEVTFGTRLSDPFAPNDGPNSAFSGQHATIAEESNLTMAVIVEESTASPAPPIAGRARQLPALPKSDPGAPGHKRLPKPVPPPPRKKTLSMTEPAAAATRDHPPPPPLKPRGSMNDDIMRKLAAAESFLSELESEPAGSHAVEEAVL